MNVLWSSQLSTYFWWHLANKSRQPMLLNTSTCQYFYQLCTYNPSRVQHSKRITLPILYPRIGGLSQTNQTTWSNYHLIETNFWKWVHFESLCLFCQQIYNQFKPYLHANSTFKLKTLFQSKLFSIHLAISHKARSSLHRIPSKV